MSTPPAGSPTAVPSTSTVWSQPVPVVVRVDGAGAASPVSGSSEKAPTASASELRSKLLEMIVANEKVRRHDQSTRKGR